MTLKDRFWWPVALLAVIWVVEILNLLSGYALNRWLGLVPRSIGGLDGILFMPVLHGSVTHAAANSVPLLVLGGLVGLTARHVLVPATAIIVLLGGLGVWLLGSAGVHIGASGLIFGWFGFLVARGLIERQVVPLLIAIGITAFYGAMMWGVLPGRAGVSWEAHLFGFAAGVGAAYVLRRRSRAAG